MSNETELSQPQLALLGLAFVLGIVCVLAIDKWTSPPDGAGQAMAQNAELEGSVIRTREVVEHIGVENGI